MSQPHMTHEERLFRAGELNGMLTRMEDELGVTIDPDGTRPSFDNGKWTARSREEYEWGLEELNEHQTAIRRHDRQTAELMRAADQPGGRESGVHLPPPDRDPGIRRHPAMPAGPDYDRARRHIDSHVRSGLLPGHAAEKATNLIEKGRPLERAVAARWAATAGDPHYLQAFAKLCADPVRGHLMWNHQEQEAYQRVEETRAMSLSDPSGGFMVPLTLDPSIMLTSAGSINPLRRISRVVQTASDQWQGVTSAGVTAEWKAEAAEAADAAPTLAGPSISVHFGDAFVPYSYEVGMDAVNFTQELVVLLVDAADQLQATAYTTGTGTGQPKGIVTALAGTGSIVTSAATDVFNTAGVDVYATQNALPARFSARAQWCAHIATINAMAKMETSAGARLFPEIGEGRLLSKPLNELSNLDGVVNATQENYILAYGDWTAGFVIVDRIGTTVELVPQLMGANRRPTGQRGLIMWFRTGADAPVINAFRLLNVT
jgi:HK97 family phage major capsid protein